MILPMGKVEPRWQTTKKGWEENNKKSLLKIETNSSNFLNYVTSTDELWIRSIIITTLPKEEEETLDAIYASWLLQN